MRAGKLRDALELDEAKVELARAYAAETDRVKAAKDIIAAVAARRARAAAPSARCLPRLAADQSDGAGDRARRVRGHHPRRIGRACPQSSALDLWRFRPRQCAEQQGQPAAGDQPLALIFRRQFGTMRRRGFGGNSSQHVDRLPGQLLRKHRNAGIDGERIETAHPDLLGGGKRVGREFDRARPFGVRHPIGGIGGSKSPRPAANCRPATSPGNSRIRAEYAWRQR